jgi:hypothetical protein
MGSAVDVRFSLSAATHAPPGLHHRYLALREETVKVRSGGVSVCRGLPGEFGVSSAACLAPVTQTAGEWCKSSPALPHFNDSCSLGVGAIVSCNSCDPHLPWPSGEQEVGAGWWPASPQGPAEMCVRVPGCAGVCFWGPERGCRGKMEFPDFLEQKCGLWERGRTDDRLTGSGDGTGSFLRGSWGFMLSVLA